MSYEFGSILYRTPREMCDGIAEQWLSAGGTNKLPDMQEALDRLTDEQLADECIEGWGLDEPVDQGDDFPNPTCMQTREAERDDLVTAFQVLRDNLEERFAE